MPSFPDQNEVTSFSAAAFGTQSWADPTTGLIHVFLIQCDKLTPNPDDSLMRRAYQDAIAAALKP